jgi:hypothetical protein
MELIKANSADVFTIEINGSLPEKEFEFTDRSVLPRIQYFYTVVAIGLSDEEKWLRSKPSAPKAGQAYDLMPPEPPGFISLTRDDSGAASEISVKWHSQEKLTCLLKRRIQGTTLFQTVSDWLDNGVFSETENRWKYEYLDSVEAQAGLEYVYLIAAKDNAGNLTISRESSIV